MKIEYRKGDMFTSRERLILHGCNNKGEMNTGVAGKIRELWPHVYKEYHDWCVGGNRLGDYHISTAPNRIIVNAVIQDGFGYRGGRFVNYEALAQVCEKLDIFFLDKPQKSIVMPKIGSDRGGGSWNVISSIIESSFIVLQPIVYELDKEPAV